MAEAQAPGRRAAATTAPGPPDFMLGGEPEMQAPGNKPGRQPVTGPDSDRLWRHRGPRVLIRVPHTDRIGADSDGASGIATFSHDSGSQSPGQVRNCW